MHTNSFEYNMIPLYQFRQKIETFLSKNIVLFIGSKIYFMELKNSQLYHRVLHIQK